MKFNPTTRTLTLEPTDCRRCSHQRVLGTMPAKEACPTCEGTGKGPRGGARGCRACSGFGHHWNHDVRVPCESCGGAFESFDSETFCDDAPFEAIEAMPMSFLILDRENTWNESHIGM